MAGNLRGVLISIIFVVDLIGSHEIFSPTKINAYGDMVMQVHDNGRGHKHLGSTANISQSYSYYGSKQQ